MKTLLADFHIHTLLSPCAEIEMTPHHIVMRAAQYGVDAVAITDHNASANAAAAVEAAKNYGVKVFPGMEVECREEAHIVVLFDTLEQLAAWQKIVDANMSGLKNNAERFGAQFIVDDAAWAFKTARCGSYTKSKRYGRHGNSCACGQAFVQPFDAAWLSAFGYGAGSG